ncbi:MAG: hypothetical protein ABIJ34_03850 [archaeon]
MYIAIIFKDLLSVYLEFMYAPLMFPAMLLVIAPLFLFNLLIEIYYEKNHRGGVGHHRNLENAVYLIFVSFSLFQYVFSFSHLSYPRLFLTTLFAIFALVISVFDFFNKLPIDLLFKRSAKFHVTFVTYVAATVIYSDMLNFVSYIMIFQIIVAAALFFITVLTIRYMLTVLEPKSYEELEHFLSDIERDIKKTHERTNQPSERNIKKKKKAS